MININLKKLSATAGALSLVLSVSMSVPVSAMDKMTPEQMRQHEASLAQSKGKLDESRRMNCKKHQENIRRILRKAASQAERQIATFDRISKRTQDFVADKKLNVPNYAALLADIAAKRAAVVADIHSLRQGVDFDCDKDDPDGQGKVISANIHKLREALKDYRTSIRNLIVAVHTATSSASKGAQ